MNWGEAAQLITAIAAVGAVSMSYRNSRKIEQVHISINSRMDQLLKTSGDAMKAEGVAEERANNIAKGA
jgi:hypothetical protein